MPQKKSARMTPHSARPIITVMKMEVESRVVCRPGMGLCMLTDSGWSALGGHGSSCMHSSASCQRSEPIATMLFMNRCTMGLLSSP